MTEVTREDVGSACWFYDPRGRRYDALITAVHGPQCVNVVYVNDVEGQTDHYGQKLQRSSSVMHGSIQQAWGNFWLKVGEARPERGQHDPKHDDAEAARRAGDSSIA